jgi:threonine/homoserine/homoserine lactone efflux protein
MENTLETLLTLALFAFVTSVTPGPNNLMLLSSGVNFGWKRTLPHMFGVGLGFTFMVFMVGIGVVQLFDAFPAAYEILKWVSVVYLVYLAFKISQSGEVSTSDEKKTKPMTFLQAVMFQWVNPKAWTMALSAISIYAPERDLMSILWVSAVYCVVNIPSISVWVVLGQKLQLWLKSAIQLKVFNYSMALLLVASVLPVVW